MQSGTWPVNWFPDAGAPKFMKNARPMPVCAAARQHCVFWQRCAARECSISWQPCAPCRYSPLPHACVYVYVYLRILLPSSTRQPHPAETPSLPPVFPGSARDDAAAGFQCALGSFPRPQPPTPRIHTSGTSSIDRPVPDARIQAAAVQRGPCDQIRPMSPLHLPPPLSAP